MGGVFQRHTAPQCSLHVTHRQAGTEDWGAGLLGGLGSIPATRDHSGDGEVGGAPVHSLKLGGAKMPGPRSSAHLL